MSGAAVNENRVVLQNEFIVFPLGKIFKTIAAHDNCELMCGIFFLQIGECVHRVGGLRQFEFNIACF